MKRQRIASAVVALASAVTLAACGVGTTTGSGTSSTTTTSASSTGSPSAGLSDDVTSHAEADDAAYDTASAVTVTLADGASTASSDTAKVDGDVVTITAPGTYVLSGSLSDGQVVVSSDAEGKVRIVLAGASVSSSTTSPFVVTAADEVVVVLQDGTTNALSDGASYGDANISDDPNATLFSMADLTITGTGALNVAGNNNDGIASKDGLVIQSGSVTVTAKDDGIRGKDYLIVENGTVSVTAGGDALKSDNETDDTVGYIAVSGGTVVLDAGDDGAHAEGDLAVSGGTVTVKKSSEGLEGATVTISGGRVDVTSSDDGINVSMGSSGSGQQGGGGMQDQTSQGAVLTISGGDTTVNSGGDGLDSNGSITVTGGTTVVSGPTGSGNGALDSNGGITVQGGTVLAAGSAGMAESPATESAVGWVSVSLPSSVAAGQTVSVVSGDTVIASYTAVKNIQSVVLAAAGITNGQSYDVYVGGSLASTTTGTYSAGGSIDGATKVATATAGQAAAGGGFGGRSGGGRG